MDEREKLIALIREGNGGYDFASVERIADYLLANGVTIQRWIPVEERLPETGGYYLVHQMNPRYRMSVIQHARYSENKERWLGAQAMCSLDFVTHWMPLPQPPKEVE